MNASKMERTPMACVGGSREECLEKGRRCKGRETIISLLEKPMFSHKSKNTAIRLGNVNDGQFYGL